MIFGSPLASGYGDPNNVIAFMYLDANRLDNGRLYLNFEPRSGYGDAWFSIYINDIFCGNRYVTEATKFAMAIPPPAFATECVVTILRIGHAGDPGYNIARVARQMETDESPFVSWQWTWKPTFAAIDGDGQFTSAWTLTGITRKNTTNVTGNNFWGQLSVNYTIDAGVGTIDIYNRTVLVATGSATIGGSPFTITIDPVAPLVDDGMAGISGTVVMDDAATEFTDATLYYKWPASMNILRDTSSPPTTVVDNMPFNKQDKGMWTETETLTPGPYYYAIQEVSDDDVAGTATAAQREVVNGPPEPPTNFVFVSEVAY